MLSTHPPDPDEDRNLRKPVTITLEQFTPPKPRLAAKTPDELLDVKKPRARPPRKTVKKKTPKVKKKILKKKPAARPKPRPRPKPRRTRPKKQELVKVRLKMVEQDFPKDEKAPKRYRFLAQKNRNVEKETRARKTMLRKVPAGPPELAKGKRTPAQATDKPGKRRRLRQKARPRPRPRAVARRKKKKVIKKKTRHPMTRIVRRVRKPSRPSARRVATRHVKMGPHPDGKRKLVVQRKPRKPSILSMRQPRRMTRRPLTIRKLMPTNRQIKRMFAVEWRKEAYRRRDEHRRAGRLRASRNPSAKRWKRIRAAIENYIAEVKPGNQTALRTRAHPFAAYIAKMHRSIHPLWGHGFLADWDLKSSSDPMNVSTRWAMLEIVLNRDGTLNKAGLVKPSGYTPFDAAALDVVFTAAPFGKPHRPIPSADKKVYLHWRFHRDQRQCGTFGVNAYILTKPPKGKHIDKRAAAAASARARWDPARALKQLKRTPKPGGRVTVLRATQKGARRTGPVSQPHRGQTGRTGPAAAPTGRAAAPAGRASATSSRSKDARPGKTGRSRSSGAAKPRPKPRKPSMHRFGEAGSVAGQWLGALSSGDVDRMVALSAVPFKANGKVAAKKKAGLKKAFAGLAAEVKAGRRRRATAPPLVLKTASGLRRYLGIMPKGVPSSAANLYAVTRIGRDRVILVLTSQGNTYRVTGLQR
jgi:TonB family protein